MGLSAFRIAFLILTYTDLEPLAKTKSKWKQFIADPVESDWDFGDGNPLFDATGRIICSQYWQFPPGLEPSHTPAPIRLEGVFKIKDGIWKDTLIVGGQADWHFTLWVHSTFC